MMSKYAIQLQFVRGRGLSSAAIAWFGAGVYSHVDAIVPGGELLGARSDRIGYIDPGVQVRPAYYENWKMRDVWSLLVSESVYQRFHTFLREQLYKPYDSTAIWGFVAGRDWRDDKAWFCSELQAAALEYSEAIPRLSTKSNKVMPGTLATIMSAVGALKLV
jgi:hypothetical protein